MCKYAMRWISIQKPNHFWIKKIIFHQQDCSEPWEIDPNSLDLVFTSNFFEHLPNKESLDRTMGEIKKP